MCLTSARSNTSVAIVAFFFFFTCNLKLSHLFVNLHDSKIVTKLVFLTRQVPKEEFFFFFFKGGILMGVRMG